MGLQSTDHGNTFQNRIRHISFGRWDSPDPFISSMKPFTSANAGFCKRNATQYMASVMHSMHCAHVQKDYMSIRGQLVVPTLLSQIAVMALQVSKCILWRFQCLDGSFLMTASACRDTQ